MLSMFRDTSSTKIESIGRTVTHLFDGHKDARMARFLPQLGLTSFDFEFPEFSGYVPGATGR